MLLAVLEGRPHPLGRRLVNLQRCLRTTDLDEVGDGTHLTVFEMLGSWSLGDYDHQQSLRWGYELLRDGYGSDSTTTRQARPHRRAQAHQHGSPSDTTGQALEHVWDLLTQHHEQHHDRPNRCCRRNHSEMLQRARAAPPAASVL